MIIAISAIISKISLLDVLFHKIITPHVTTPYGDPLQSIFWFIPCIQCIPVLQLWNNSENPNYSKFANISINHPNKTKYVYLSFGLKAHI